MDFLTLAKNRYSERAFSEQPIEEEKLAQILEAGRLAPTACNYQPERIYVIKSPEALSKAGKLTYIYNAPTVLLVCYDLSEAWKNPRDHFYETYCSGEQDATIVAASMMYAAENLGVHSIWLRGFDSKAVVDAFSIPENIIPVMMLALGYPSDRSKPNPWHFKRKDLTEIVEER